ncbi:MAG TPA: hypothetical protein VNI20_02835 [Fimbriimonadaceae bacterium]|nr:hypothetical protein [Fimbriimonadaceae bacterium]
MITAAVLTCAVLTARVQQQTDPFARYKADLPKIGTVAPDFKTTNDKGDTYELHKSFKNAKGTLLNFWFAH